MDATRVINKFVYVPSVKLRIQNLAIFLCVGVLVFLFQLFPISVDTLGALVRRRDQSLRGIVLVFLVGFCVSFAVLHSGVDRYFLGQRHALQATFGTTVVVCIAYATMWCLFQIGEGKQSFVLLSPSEWALKETFDSLGAGTLLAVFSSVGLNSRLILKDESAHDFGEFQKEARDWKSLIKRRSTQEFGQGDHARLLALTGSMIEALSSRTGWVQPAVEESAKTLHKWLEEFRVWYLDQTPGNLYSEFRGFDTAMAEKIKLMRRLC